MRNKTTDERRQLALLRHSLNGEFGANSGHSPDGEDAPEVAIRAYVILGTMEFSMNFPSSSKRNVIVPASIAATAASLVHP